MNSDGTFAIENEVVARKSVVSQLIDVLMLANLFMRFGFDLADAFASPLTEAVHLLEISENLSKGLALWVPQAGSLPTAHSSLLSSG